ncbi:MAG: hypothetical protein HYZ81_25175 [Nitrospinae bacterium]|nr:hypothetical protein [Nitrospinota bacterium]
MGWWIVPALLLPLLQSLPAAAPAYEVVDVRDGGNIAGRVIFAGNIPSLPPLFLLKDRELCAAAASPQMLRISREDRGVKDAVISLEGITRGKAPPSDKPILDNRDCVLTPRVLAVMVGTEIVIQNSDPFLHTMRGRLPDFKQAFNLVFPKGTPAKHQKIRFPGLISVTCDTHPHMQAYILPFDHPYSAVTDAHGRFEISHIPAGKYLVRAWHEGWNILGYDKDGRPWSDEPHVMTAEVAVRAGEASQVEFQLSARD